MFTNGVLEQGILIGSKTAAKITQSYARHFKAKSDFVIDNNNVFLEI